MSSFGHIISKLSIDRLARECKEISIELISFLIKKTVNIIILKQIQLLQIHMVIIDYLVEK